MSPDEALEYKKQGGKLAEPVSQRELILFDVEQHFESRGTVIVMTSIPATNPAHEHGHSDQFHKEAIAASQAGRIVRKVLK